MTVFGGLAIALLSVALFIDLVIMVGSAFTFDSDKESPRVLQTSIFIFLYLIGSSLLFVAGVFSGMV